MNDPTDLQGQASEAESEQQTAQRARLQQIDDLKWLMAHPQGRRLATRIFERTGTRRTPFHSSGSQMAFNAGAQNVGLWLEAEILETSFDGYVKLLKEFQK